MHTKATPICARCGYNLSGTVASWSDACPVRGTCPECGFDQAWREVFNPLYRHVPELFEHGRGLAIGRFACTLGGLLNPWRMWSRIGLNARVAPRRLAAFVVVLLLLAHLVNTAAAGSVTASQWSFAPPSRSWAMDELRATLAFPYRLALDEIWWWTNPWSHMVIATALLGGALVPFCYALLPTTLRRARVRLRHRVRVGAYAFLAGVLVSSFVFVLLISREWHPLWDWTYGLNWTTSAALVVAPGVFAGWGHWAIATRRYLGLEHPLAVATATVTVALLLAGILATGLAIGWMQTR